MKSGFSRISLALVVLVTFAQLGSIPMAGATVRYTVTDLGPGIPMDINNNGLVVGHNFYWDSLGGWRNSTSFNGVNDNGLAVTYAGTGQIIDLNTGEQFFMSGGAVNGEAINNLGQVTGLASLGLPGRSFIWDNVNGTQIIGFGIHAWDINDAGQVVGEGTSSGSTAFIWDKDNGLKDIGALIEGLGSFAYGINNLGQVVGGSQFAVGNTKPHAFLWHEGHGMQDLETLGYKPPASDESYAFDINIHGQVVGRSNSNGTTRSGWVAFIWDSTNGMQDLNNLIPFGSGWKLETPFAINDHGQIVGYGHIEGTEEERAFLLTPLPSPIPQIVVSPIFHDFGRVVVDHLSEPFTINIRNYGDVNLIVSDISLSDKINFSLSGHTAATILPGSSHSVAVTFRPQSMGQHNATLSITSDDPSKPNVTVTLSGEGEAGIWGCINFQGVPLAGVKVVLEQKRGKKQVVETDAEGCYAFQHVAPNRNFEISIEGSVVPK